MNSIVLDPNDGGLTSTYVSDGRSLCTVSAPAERCDEEDPISLVCSIAAGFRSAGHGVPHLIAVRAIFGGEVFPAPTRVTADVVAALDSLSPMAPLHGPRLVNLLRACSHTWPDVPLFVVFETSFFVSLPMREQRYALDSSTAEALGARRWGFHGIHHEAACAHLRRELRASGLREIPRILSVCLEPKPEAAAVVGARPVMVTGGTTPTDGLPGETICGEMDPALALIIARRMGWGPERVNLLLTRDSGLLGMTGRRITFDDLFGNERPEEELAREVFRYRLLLTAGAAVAAMGRLDGLVFSGRYTQAGRSLARWLGERLAFLPQPPSGNRIVEVFVRPIGELVAEAAARAWLTQEMDARAGAEERSSTAIAR